MAWQKCGELWCADRTGESWCLLLTGADKFELSRVREWQARRPRPPELKNARCVAAALNLSSIAVTLPRAYTPDEGHDSCVLRVLTKTSE